MSEQEKKQDTVYTFECRRCGEASELPFEPKNPDTILCRECYREVGGRTYDLSKVRKAPRRKHGTRVVFPIICSECGVEEELDYVPKGVPMNEILCSMCMEERAGQESRWKLVSEQKDAEAGRRPEYEIICATCGKPSSVPFEPKPDRDYYCRTCMARHGGFPEEDEQQQQPQKFGLGENVFIRRKKKNDEKSDETSDEKTDQE